PEREAALELVPIGPAGAAATPPGDLPALAHDVMPLSSEEVDYPALREIHQPSSLRTPADVVAWRRAAAPAASEARDPVIALPAPPIARPPLCSARQALRG